MTGAGEVGLQPQISAKAVTAFPAWAPQARAAEHSMPLMTGMPLGRGPTGSPFSQTGLAEVGWGEGSRAREKAVQPSSCCPHPADVA